MTKFLLPVGIIVSLLVVFTAVYLFTSQKPVSAPTSEEGQATQNQVTNPSVPPSFKGKEDVLKDALNLYIQKKQSGLDMSKGPCLGTVKGDYAIDIVHKPRIQADDEAKNQCPDYVSGKVKHYIELDPSGNLIRSD